jgi:vacuolar-type H+-ATPase subunit E/Vma4
VRVLGSVASLVEAVREDVEAELARIREETENEAERLGRVREAESTEVPDRASRLESARREAAERLAREDWADRRAALEDREEWITQASAEGLAALAKSDGGSERRELLERFIREALERLPGERFEVTLAAADSALLDEEECRRLSALADKGEIVPKSDGSARPGSCVVRAAGGKMSFDNGLEARARRFDGSCRAALAELYGP